MTTGAIETAMIKLKALSLFAACIAMAGCISEEINARKQALDTPVRITIRVLDKNNQPIPGTVALVKQSLKVGERLFCMNLLGKNCDKYRNVHIFKGDVGSDGEVSFDVQYASLLTILVANPCQDPKGHRRYFNRSVAWKVLSKQRVLILSNEWDPKNGFSVGDLPCETTTPPFKSWDDYY